MEEIWKPIPGWGNYEVSDKGRVKSIDREIKPKNKKSYICKGKILKACLNSQGYPTVNLCKLPRRSTYKIHALVSLAFMGPLPEEKQVNHIDDNKLNNCVENLYFGTHQDNMDDAILNQKDTKRIFSDQQIFEIRKLYIIDKKKQIDIAKSFNTTSDVIWKIVNFKSYKHLE